MKMTDDADARLERELIFFGVGRGRGAAGVQYSSLTGGTYAVTTATKPLDKI